MTDVELLDFGDRRDRRDVAGRESVTGVDRETEVVSVTRRVLERAKHGRIVRMVRVSTGVQLDGHGAEVARPRHRFDVGVDEEARANPNRRQLLNGRSQRLRVSRHVQATFGRDLFAPLRNEA